MSRRARHRADTRAFRLSGVRRPRRTSRRRIRPIGPPLLVALLLTVSTAALASEPDAGQRAVQTPAAVTANAGG